MMNAIDKLFSEKKKNILSIYFTAGFPKLNDTIQILESLTNSGVDLVEIGMPFSDPLADGPVIQESSRIALENGMSIKLLFEQLENSKFEIRNSRLAIILMGYLNPVMQYGIDNFCKKASELGISGVILPDLPMDVYLNEYKTIFEKYNLKNIFLITPQTSEKRIKFIDENSNGFIYMVSSASTTGVKNDIDEEKEKYFARIKNMNLKNPLIIGFGISDKKTFQKACEYATGAIIGSAFIKQLELDSENGIADFIKKIKN
jgi:tryptophan synthase alpha chain